MNALYNTMERFRPLVLSILRIVVGLLFLEHGLSKVFGFPAASPVASLSGLLLLAAFLETIGAVLFVLAPARGSWRSSCGPNGPSLISWRTLHKIVLSARQ